MPLTLTAEEARLLARCGPWLTLVGLPTAASIVDVPNVLALYALSDAAEILGVTVAVPGAPTDEELARIAAKNTIPFRDLAELKLLESVLLASTGIAQSESFESHSVSYGATRGGLTDRIAWLRKQYGRYFLAPGVAATLRVRSASRCGWPEV